MTGARIFVAIVFVVLGAAFLASTGLLIVEFQELDWLTMLVAHSHLFLFFPSFGLLALVAFYLPSVVLTHLYWTHLPYGKARFVVGVLVLAGLSYLFAGSLDKEPRAIYEAAPFALAADKGDQAAGRVAILDALGTLRKTAQQRFGLSSFGRSCMRDPMLEVPDEYLKERYCFPAKKNLNGEACCAVQAAFSKAVSRLQRNPETRSFSADMDRLLFLPLKAFFILVVVAIAVLLAFWRDRIDQLYADKIANLERGIIIGGFAMLFWLAMDYGYQQTANVLYGRMTAGPQLRLSLVLVPWALLLLFYFLRRLGRQGELVGQISGVVFAGVAVLRYEQLNDWVVRLFGIGADGWVLAVLVAIPAVGLAALYWFRNAGIYGRRSASSA
ncbi:MAG TPA: hypothetical protein VN524_16275 [Hyphomicrobiaceae bacterium]|nr:hypothetical protein [Hyphomicrobiaceae bacterium]